METVEDIIIFLKEKGFPDFVCNRFQSWFMLL